MKGENSAQCLEQSKQQINVVPGVENVPNGNAQR